MKPRLFALGVVFVMLLGLALGQLWPGGVGQGAAANSDRNGIWLDVEWSAEARPAAEVAALVDDLAARGFRYGYVYANSVNADGSPAPRTYAHAGPFVQTAKAAQPDFQLLAWIGVVNQARGQGKVDIEDPAVRANLVAFCHELTAELGFDGVQLNVEPLPNGSTAYLDLLDEVRAALGQDKVLSIAGHKWAPAFVPSPEDYSSYWLADYYRAVGSRVDQVAVMTYDTYSPTPLAYRLFLREQMVGILSALAETETEVLVGIPAYDEPRPNHNPQAENVATGLVGTLDALARTPNAARERFAGIALYAHWEITDDEWQTYDSLWRGR
ncbi:MAG: glycosyl hydrolase family 18 protein [Chloroflexota bacterium]